MTAQFPYLFRKVWTLHRCHFARTRLFGYPNKVIRMSQRDYWDILHRDTKCRRTHDAQMGMTLTGSAPAECALCRTTAPLRRSHIIPEFLYAAVYDEGHSFLVTSTDPGDRPTIRQKGLWESLLCDACEGRLSGWEDYAKRVLAGEGVTITREGESLLITPVEYARLKLFQLSLLWRAGVSKRPEFAAVDLGRHEESLRQMLFAGDPGKVQDFGCSVVFPPDLEAQEIFRHAIGPPTVGRYQAHHVYRFVLGMLCWIFIVSGHMRELSSSLFSLSDDGSFRVRNGGQPAMRYLVGFARDVTTAGEARDLGGRLRWS